jgi:hypothetical protein
MLTFIALTRMTRASLNKHAVCRQVPEMRNIEDDARRKYQTALGELATDISPSSATGFTFAGYECRFILVCLRFAIFIADHYMINIPVCCGLIT